MWGATSCGCPSRPAPCDFNPRSPCGERPPLLPDHLVGQHFNPRSPCGERRWPVSIGAPSLLFQSTLPVWGATLCKPVAQRSRVISIHAPRVGSDDNLGIAGATTEISIHAPRVGSDQFPRVQNRAQIHFNPRSPCGERPAATDVLAELGEFQSTLPVWGATWHTGQFGTTISFQSTLPVWGATYAHRHQRRQRADFNPRSPCGERLTIKVTSFDYLSISIHAPRVGSDTGFFLGNKYAICISIHAPRVGSDSMLTLIPLLIRIFQSTLPVWGATAIYSTIQNQKQYLVN